MKNGTLTKTTALVLLVTMIALVMISGTFAKYTDQYDGTGTAIVAKWKVKLKDLEGNDLSQAATFNLFDKTGVYDLKGVNADDLSTATATVDADVADGTGDDAIVAPGTWGKIGFKIDVEGENEVTVRYGLNITSIVTTLPLEFSVDGQNWQTVAEIENEITNGSGSYQIVNDTVQPKTAATNKEAILYWRWLYERSADSADTGLGRDGTATCTITAKFDATQDD